MSKRGGTSNVNGFISLGPSEKKTSKDKDKSIEKRSKSTVQRAKDLSHESTQKRKRLVETTVKAETSNTGGNKTELNAGEKVVASSSKSGDAQRYDAKNTREMNKPSKRTSKPSMSSEKLSSGVPKIRPNTINKKKESVSSPYIAHKTTNSSIVEKSPQIHKTSTANSQSKSSPYKTSIAQKTQSRTVKLALEDKTRKTRQLPDTSNAKTSKPSAAKTSKPTAKPAPSKFKSTSSTKSKTLSEKLDSKIIENLECEEQAITFGEIPRSNTFTKENDKDKGSVSQESASNSSNTAQEEDYTYEDDFEDYASDFDDYVQSHDSTSETSEEEDEEDSSDTTEEDDEDVIGDGLIATTSKIFFKETPIRLLPEESYGVKVAETNDNQSDKDKTLRVEEERKLDSGSYDMASNLDLRRKKQIQEVRAAIDIENAKLNTQKTSHGKSLMYLEDEGFEEVCQDNFSNLENSCLIDFSIAQKQQAKIKVKENSKRRGELLMKMIKLDAMSFHHLDIPSVPYEVYMKCYGRSNTLQIYTQTNDDALSEEIQTEDIKTLSKWTQHPVKYSSLKSSEDVLSLFVQEKLGVGGESTIIQETDGFMPNLHTDSLRLHNFINTAGEFILTLLEESEQDQRLQVNAKSAMKKKDFGFSESYTSLNVGKVEFLKDRPISLVCFSENNRSQILSVHKPSTKPLTIQDESEGRCVLCVWSIHEPSCPRQTLVAANNASAVCFHSHLIFAGLVDGALCLWDLREQSAIHCRSYLKQPSWLLRSPTYITANLGKGKQHLSPVVSLRILPESNAEDGTLLLTQTPNQVVSLDEEGVLFIWTVVGSIKSSQEGLNKSASVIDMGLAPWGRVRLVQSSQLNILNAFPKPNLGMVQCQCMVVDRLRPSNLYIGTNSGQVAHCLQTSTRTRPQLYQPDQELKHSITCMDFSRCGHSLLMVGDRGGHVRVYHTQTAQPLLNLSAASDANRPLPLLALQWSPSQPGLFFVLDAESCIHIWDLCISDMNPQMSVPFPRQNITSISLTASMLALATESGDVDIYNLKSEFGPLSEEDGTKQNNKFSRYISIL